MDINRSESVAPIGNRDSRQDYRPRHDDPEKHSDKEQAKGDDHADRWFDDDAVAVDAALMNAMPPALQDALTALAERLEPMRQDLERALARESALHEQLEKHPYLPVLNRHGLEHEVSRIAGRLSAMSSGSRSAPLFVCITVSNAAEIRRVRGRAAYDRVMTVACEILKSCFSEHDVIGCLGGDDLGVIVIEPMSEGHEKSLEAAADHVASAFNQRHVSLDGGAQSILVDVGVSSLDDHRTFASALAAADAHLLQRASL